MTQKRKSTAVRKKQIIDAARKLIIKKGSEHLTVRSIAKEVDITEAAIYRHFNSKRQILSFLMEHIMTSMLEEVDRSLAQNGTSVETINEILKNHLSEIEQRRGMSFQVIAEIISLGDKKLNREVFEKLVLYIERLKGLISDAAQAGPVRGDVDFSAAALLLFGLIQGLVNFWALSNYGFNLMEKYDALWGVFLKAITRPQAN
jgi:AcrR family transcriptional regulator